MERDLQEENQMKNIKIGLQNKNSVNKILKLDQQIKNSNLLFKSATISCQKNDNKECIITTKEEF